jgi:hypothetical protein
VNLVDDHDLVAVPLRPVGERLLQPAHVFDAVVRGAVDLLDVYVDARRDFDTRTALVTRGGRRAFLAVEGLGEQACCRGLSDAANPGEEECVCDAIGVDGVC